MAKAKVQQVAAEEPETFDREASAVVQDVELVRVRKGDESLDVHPLCVEAHVAVGWAREDE